MPLCELVIFNYVTQAYIPDTRHTTDSVLPGRETSGTEAQGAMLSIKPSQSDRVVYEFDG